MPKPCKSLAGFFGSGARFPPRCAAETRFLLGAGDDLHRLSFGNLIPQAHALSRASGVADITPNAGNVRRRGANGSPERRPYGRPPPRETSDPEPSR
jgi:hypothetical protein